MLREIAEMVNMALGLMLKIQSSPERIVVEELAAVPVGRVAFVPAKCTDMNAFPGPSFTIRMLLPSAGRLTGALADVVAEMLKVSALQLNGFGFIFSPESRAMTFTSPYGVERINIAVRVHLPWGKIPH